MPVSTWKPKRTDFKLSELIKQFIKFVGYENKKNFFKNPSNFPCINHNQLENREEVISFLIATKNMKYLKINLISNK